MRDVTDSQVRDQGILHLPLRNRTEGPNQRVPHQEQQGILNLKCCDYVTLSGFYSISFFCIIMKLIIKYVPIEQRLSFFNDSSPGWV